MVVKVIVYHVAEVTSKMWTDKDFINELYKEFYNARSLTKDDAWYLAEFTISFLKQHGWRSPKDCDECEGGL
jgi:hypothetical protein